MAVVVQHKKLVVHSNSLLPNLPNIFWNIKKKLMEQNHCILAVSPIIACFFCLFCVHRKVTAVVSKYVCSFLPPTHHPAWQALSTPKTWNHPHCFSRTGLGKNAALMITCSLIVLPMSPVRFFQSLILGERHNGWVSTKQPRILQSWAMLGNRITITIHN